MARQEALPLIHIVIKKTDGEMVEVIFQMSPEAFTEVQDIARKRGTSLIEVFGEALRLEKLFADIRDSDDQSLLIRKGRDYQELITV